MAKRLLCVAVISVFIVVLFVPAFALPGFSFTVVENEICEFSYHYFPQTLFGNLYLPHFVFELNSEWGFRSYWNTTTRTFSIYTGTQMLTFDIGAGKAFDISQTYNERAVRNNIGGVNIFMLPAQFVCDYFNDLKLTQYETNVGTMVRIVKKSTVSDYLFVGIYRNVIQTLYDEYSNPPPTPSPSPTVGPPLPTPTASVRPSPTPSPSPSPSPTPEPEPTIVYITFNGSPGLWTSNVIDTLDSRGVKATFFLTAGDMAESPEITRRIASTHAVGLLLQASGDSLADLAEKCNGILRGASFYRTRLIRAPDASDDEISALNDGGWRIWRDNPLDCDWTDNVSVLDALSRALAKSPAVITLPAEAAHMLPAILDAMPSRSYTLLPLTPSSRAY